MVSRRTVLRNIAGTAVVIGGGFAAGFGLLKKRPRRYPVIPGEYSHEGVRLIRPPGAVDEAAFLAACIRCYRCQDACEPGAIQFFTETHGTHYHTPYIDPSVKACTLCMKCTQVCPTGVLRPMQPTHKAKVAMATVELRKDLCLSYKAKRIRDEQAMLMALGQAPTEATGELQRRGPCGECYMFCPLRRRAIKLEPGAFLAPIIFQDACVGCGLCEEICRVMVRGEPAIRIVSKRGVV
jgi:ferredoxin